MIYNIWLWVYTKCSYLTEIKKEDPNGVLANIEYVASYFLWYLHKQITTFLVDKPFTKVAPDPYNRLRKYISKTDQEGLTGKKINEFSIEIVEKIYKK